MEFEAAKCLQQSQTCSTYNNVPQLRGSFFRDYCNMGHWWYRLYAWQNAQVMPRGLHREPK